MHPSAAQITGLYERHAHGWDRDRGKSLFERSWLDKFLGVARCCNSILDIGCGSGEPIARYFVESGRTVTGVDAAPSLVRLCQDRFPEHTWIAGDMRSLQLGKTFGGILAWDSFFHLSPADQRAMFPIFRAHAGHGTALMFTSGPSAGEVVGCYRGEDLYHASLDADEYRGLLDAHGFGVLDWAVEDPSCGGHTIWLAQAR